MQHGKKTVKLGRTTSHRDAMLANMATSLFLHERITTTTIKAKALRPLVDRLITTAKKGTLHSHREVARTIKDKQVLKKLFEEIVPKLDERTSGYSRLMRSGFRKGDGAEMAILELLVERAAEAPEKKEKKKESRLKKITGKLKKSSGTTEAEPKTKKTAKKKPAKEAAAPEADAETEPTAESTDEVADESTDAADTGEEPEGESKEK